eukprot:symbB.v1.2.017376.t1/scaffold1349.1/size123878/3
MTDPLKAAKSQEEVFQDLLAALEKAWKRSQNSEERDFQNKRCALRTSSEINDSAEDPHGPTDCSAKQVL